MLSKENRMYANISQNENMNELDAIMLDKKFMFEKMCGEDGSQRG
jgi:hypothetical protein